MTMTPRRLALVAAIACALTAPACAGELEELRALKQTTLDLLKLLVEQGVITRDKADALLKQAERSAAAGSAASTSSNATAAAPAPSGTVVRVPYVPESVKNEIREQIKQEVLTQAKAEHWGDPGALPEWLDRIRWEGDLRIRYQGDFFDGNNTPAPVYNLITGSTLNNTTVDRNRERIRLRLGMLAAISDDLGAGLRITTGNTNEPVSNNQTLGNSFNKYSLVLDRAYLRYEPAEWATLWAGRIPNPWFSTDLVWNDSLNFDGIAGTLRPRLSDDVTAFATTGIFPLQEVEINKDKWLFGSQLGLDWDASDRAKLRLGVAYYNFKNLAGQVNDFGSTLNNYTAPQFRQKGNTVFNIANTGDPTAVLYGLASDFKELDITGSVDLAHFEPVHLTLTGDYVKNLGFKRDQVSARVGYDVTSRTDGWQVRFGAGMPRMQRYGDWQAYAGYRFLGADAVVDAFTDSDFLLGGTNAKGYFIGGAFGLTKNTSIGVKYMSGTAIDGPPLSIDVLQVDLNAAF